MFPSLGASALGDPSSVGARLLDDLSSVGARTLDDLSSVVAGVQDDPSLVGAEEPYDPVEGALAVGGLYLLSTLSLFLLHHSSACCSLNLLLLHKSLDAKA